MSLRVWLPLNGSLKNQGCSNLNTFSYNTFTSSADGKIGTCYYGQGIYHLETEIFQNTWSLCAWVKSNAWSQYNDIILCKNISESTACQFYFSIINGASLNIGINGGSSSGSIAYSFTTGVWYHVAATYDGNTYKLYINGEEKKNGTVTTAMKTGMTNIGINCRSTNAAGTSQTGDGGKRLNDIRIYDHCLSAAEVKEISQGLVVHYKLDSTYSESSQNLCTAIRPATGTNVTWGGHIAQWTNYDATNDPVPFNEGTQGEIVYGTNGSTGGGASRSICTIAASPSTTYTYSCYIKASDNLAYVHANFLYKYEYTAVSGGTKITEAGYFGSARKELLSNGWYRIWGTFTTQSNTNCIIMSFFTYPGKNVTYWLGGWQIEQKDHMTPFISPGASRTGIVYDSSGYNNNAISNGSVSITLDTNTPKYLYSTKFTSGARIATPVSASTFMPKDAITVSIWYKSSAATNRFLSCTEGGGFNFEVNSSKISFPFYISGKGYGRVNATTNFSSDNQWHMLTATYDRATAKIYRDGILDNSATITSGWENINLAYANSTPFTLGAEAQTISSPIAGTYVGNLSDCRIYCTALSAEDILALYHTSAKVDNKQNLHSFEFIENQSKISITKHGQTKCDEFEETINTKFRKDKIIETAELIEF